MIATKRISLQSKGNCDIIDITSEVELELARSGINEGVATVFVTGSTAGITTIEYESGLLDDFKNMWRRVVPENIGYNHTGNGFSHVRASLLGASLVIPFKDKKLTLGTWQQVVLVDFDNRPRSRNVVIQVMGK